MGTQIAALFDIDGTIFRDSLAVEHFNHLVKYDVIPKEAKLLTSSVQHAWENREEDYETYLSSVMNVYAQQLKGLTIEDVSFVTNKVIETHGKKLYNYTKQRIAWHKEQGHKIIFISGSPDFIVSKMAESLGADLWFGTTYLTSHGTYTGEVLPMWDAESKQRMIEQLVKQYDLELSRSYAYGDTTGDLTMLKSVGHPVAINPNARLLQELTNAKWPCTIVIERKDVIWSFKNTEIGTTITANQNAKDNPYEALAQKCLDKYPGRPIRVFLNPNYIMYEGAICEVGCYRDAKTLADDLAKVVDHIHMKETLAESWLDVFPETYTKEELAEQKKLDEKWRESILND